MLYAMNVQVLARGSCWPCSAWTGVWDCWRWHWTCCDAHTLSAARLAVHNMPP
jgi:hypothetical protein